MRIVNTQLNLTSDEILGPVHTKTFVMCGRAQQRTSLAVHGFPDSGGDAERPAPELSVELGAGLELYWLDVVPAFIADKVCSVNRPSGRRSPTRRCFDGPASDMGGAATFGSRAWIPRPKGCPSARSRSATSVIGGR